MSQKNRFLRSIAMSVAVMLVLSACDNDVIPLVSDAPTPPAATQSFDSNAVKGPLQDTLVTAVDANGAEILSFTSSGSSFELDLPINTVFPVRVSTQGGTDSITTQDLSDLNLVLRGILFDSTQTTVNINPMSTLLVETALAAGDLTTANIDAALNALSIYNFGLPEDHNPASTPMTTANSPAVLLAYETFFEVIRRVGTSRSIEPNAVLTALAADLVDGIIDGVGATGVDAQVSAAFNTISALVLIESLSGTLTLDQGGAFEKNLTSSDLNSATELVTGTAGAATNAALPPDNRVITQTVRTLLIARAATSDVDEIAAIDAAVQGLNTIPKSESASSESSNAAAAVKAASLTSLQSASTKSQDASTATTTNAKAAEVYAVSVVANSDNFTVPFGSSATLDVLANDVFSGDVTIEIIQQSDGGSLSIGTNNSIRFTPAASFAGSTSFSYRVTLDEQSSDGVVTLFVDATPAVVGQSLETGVASPLQVPLLASATGLQNTPIVVSITTNPGNGTITLAGSTATYTPAAGFAGADSFGFTATDGNGDTASATIEVFVDDHPLAQPDVGLTTPIGVPLVIAVLDNDTGKLNTPITVAIQDGTVSGGTATVGANGAVTFTPAFGFAGGASFAYSLTDADGDTSTGDVSLYVNATPVAANLDTTTLVSTPLNVDVIASATGIENAPIVIEVTGNPANGTAVAGDTIVYTPTVDFGGTDSFTYRLTDADGEQSSGTVSILVDDVPTLVDQSLITPINTLIDVDLLAGALGIGNTPLTFAITVQPSNGNAVRTGSDVAYTPNPGFASTDTFTYSITDADGDVGTATVSIYANAVPVASALDGFITEINQPIGNIDLLANATGLENIPLDITTSAAVGGTVSLNENIATFTPSPGFASTLGSNATFVYTIEDNDGETSQSTVTIYVNDTPVANTDSTTTQIDTEVFINVLSNDMGLGNEPITIDLDNPSNGTAVELAGVVTYDPAPGFASTNGITDSFTYMITDNDNESDTSSIAVYVNDTPVAVDDPLSDTPVNTTKVGIDVLANDLGLGNTPISVSIQSNSGGIATADPFTQLIDFAPTTATAGNASFVYRVTDQDLQFSDGTATIFVDDTPVANDDVAGTPLDTPIDIAVTVNDDGLLNLVDFLTVVSPPDIAKGSVLISGEIITYTPIAASATSDTFTYNITDTDGDVSNAATVTVGIGFAATDDTVNVIENTVDATDILGVATRSIDVLLNDALGPPPDAIITAVDTTGTTGTVEFTDTTITYTPAVGPFGATDTFTYSITNSTLAESATATVTVNTISLCTESDVLCVGPGEEFNTSAFGLDVERAFQNAANAATPGDTVLIRGGTYNHIEASQGTLGKEFLNISVSGTALEPITFRAFNGDSVVINGWGFVDCVAPNVVNGSGVCKSPGDVTIPTGPSSTDEILINVTGNHIHVKDMELQNSTRWGVRINGSFGFYENLKVHDSFNSNLLVLGIDKDITDNTLKNIESYRSRHEVGIWILPSVSSPQLVANTTILDSYIHHNGFQPDGQQTPGVNGDNASGFGGGNSDGVQAFKSCHEQTAQYAIQEGVPEPDNLCHGTVIRGNVAFRNADDGIDSSAGGSGTAIIDNISFNNGPEGNKAFKGFAEVRGGSDYIGNVGFGQRSFAIEVLYFGDGGLVANNSVLYNGSIAARTNAFDIRTFGMETDEGMLYFNNLGAIAGGTSSRLFSIVAGGGGFDPDLPLVETNWNQNDFQVNNVSVTGQRNNGDPLVAGTLTATIQLGIGDLTGGTYNTLDDTTVSDSLSVAEKVDVFRNRVRAVFAPANEFSPLVDAGTFKPGIHCATADDDVGTPHDPTDTTCRHWMGLAPDIGAFEFGLPPIPAAP